jgi:CRP-like cAMP-binding protein
MNAFQVDTPEKKENFYDALRLRKTVDVFCYLFSLYPELQNRKKNTQEHLSELTGITRETISRSMKKLKKEDL